MTETRCVNDTNGDGDCAACARNPQAPCRQCTDCGLTGRCAEHPANGRLSLVDCATEFRERYGDDAEDAALKLFLRPLPAHDWRFMVEYGPHPDGDPRNGRITFHDGATAEHVATYLEREHMVLAAPEVSARVDSACCGGTGYADYAAVRCPAPDCPVPEAQWRAEVTSRVTAVAQRPTPRLDRFKAMVERAIAQADGEPGDAQRTLWELRDTYRRATDG